MQRRLQCGLLALVVLLLGWFSSHAQGIDTSWEAHLYNPVSGSVEVINSSGQVSDTFTLPMLPAFDHYPAHVASGHGGSPLAYVAYNSITYQGAVIISQRDRIVTSAALPLTIATSTEFVADESAFNDDNTRFALGYSLDGGGWAVIVVNLITGGIDYTIRSDMPQVSTSGIPNTAGLTPVIRQFSLQTVSFNLILSGTEANSALKAYDWKIDSNDLIPNPVYTSLDSDRLNITDEVIMTAADNRIENQQAAFPFSQANSLQVYEILTGARFPFFNLPNATLQTPRFIQNGERILVDTATADGRYAWMVVERNGAVVGTLPTAVTLNEIKGVADGFVYTTDSFAPGARTLVYVDTRAALNAGVPIWTGNAGEQPLLIWAGSTSISAQLAAISYVAWAQLAAPIYAPGSIPVIAPAPDQPLLVNPVAVGTPETTRSSITTLGEGVAALVHTTNGNQLNVRAGAGTNYQIVAKLGDGARVTILEGPNTADGFTWWRVRTNSGIAGWVVDSVDDDGKRLQTLLPA